jgi:hypothetical protein
MLSQISFRRRAIPNVSSPSQFYYSFPLSRFGVVNEIKANFFADVLHSAIFQEYRTDDAVQFFFPANLDKKLQQFRANAQFVPSISDQEGKFGLVCAVKLA